MKLIRNIDQGKTDTLAGEVWFGLFDSYLQFIVDNAASLDYVEKCGVYLNELSEVTVKSVCEASIRYCNDCLKALGYPTKTFSNYRDVLNLITPATLIIPDPEQGDDPVIWMELNCEWELEHGMEWVIRRDGVMYVGSFDGTYPWGEIEKNVPGNYA